MKRRGKKEWFGDPQGIWGKKYIIDYEDILPRERTFREAKFTIRALGLKPGDKLLDLACGYGRHSIFFAQKGLKVTGFDLSRILLRSARSSAAKSGVSVRWMRGDMRSLGFKNEFRAAVILFTSLGYFERVADNAEVIKGVYRALQPGGLFLLDMSNRDYLLSHFERKGWHRHKDGSTTLEVKEYDHRTNFIREKKIFIEKNGKTRETRMSFKVFSAKELKLLVSRGGFKIKNSWGDFSGGKLTPRSRRIIILGQKPWVR